MKFNPLSGCVSLPERCRRMKPAQKRLCRVGIASLAIMLTVVGTVPFFNSRAAEEIVVSNSDSVNFDPVDCDSVNRNTTDTDYSEGLDVAAGDSETDTGNLRMIKKSVESVRSFSAGGCGRNASYTLENGVLTISGSGSISSNAFNPSNGNGFDNIEKVVFAEGSSITGIGSSAFANCKGLNSIVMANSITTIEDYAFAECENLSSVTFSNSLKTIGVRGFYKCNSLSSITLPDSVTYIKSYSFSECENLSSVTLSQNLETIGHHAFYCLSHVSSLVIPSKVRSISVDAFRACTDLTSVVFQTTELNGGDFTYHKSPTHIYLCELTILDKKITEENASAYFGNAVVHIGHRWDSWNVTQQPTCSAPGSRTHTCLNNSLHTETEEIPIAPEAHNWDEWVVSRKATCTVPGILSRTCLNDPTHTETEEMAIDSEAHDWGEWIVTQQPTCTVPGSRTRTCLNDPSHTETEEIPIVPDAHNWSKWDIIRQPTCAAAGSRTRTCLINPSHIETEEMAIDPDAHDWDYKNGVIDGNLKTIVYTCVNDRSHTASVQLNELCFTSDSQNSWKKGSTDGMLFVVKNPDEIQDLLAFPNFEKIYVDGKELNLGTDYLAESGSARITLSPDYLNSLSDGRHTLRVQFTFTSVGTDFRVTSAGGASSPATGESGLPTWLCIALLIAAASGGVYVACRRRPLNESAE